MDSDSEFSDSFFSTCCGFTLSDHRDIKEYTQRSPEDFVLDIRNANVNFAEISHLTIDSLSIDVFHPRPGFLMHTLKEGKQFILKDPALDIRRVILISNEYGFFVLYVQHCGDSRFFFKTDSEWHPIGPSEYIQKLKEARSIRPIKEISIDTSTRIIKQGLILSRYKYDDLYQVTYTPNFGYEARSVLYRDDVVWKTENDTQRCVYATVVLNNYNPVGMTTLIYDDRLFYRIYYYRFENKWTEIEEEDYMKLVRSYKRFKSDFEIRNHKPQLSLMIDCYLKDRPNIEIKKFDNPPET